MLGVGMHDILKTFSLCQTAANVRGADMLHRALCAYHFGAEARIVRGVPICHMQFVIVIVLVSPTLANGIGAEAVEKIDQHAAIGNHALTTLIAAL